MRYYDIYRPGKDFDTKLFLRKEFFGHGPGQFKVKGIIIFLDLTHLRKEVWGIKGGVRGFKGG